MRALDPVGNTSTGENTLRVPLRGRELLRDPFYNKDSAFTEEEREKFGLEGLLPTRTETLEEQVRRVYANYSKLAGDFERYLFLTDLQDRNETLFYRVLYEHPTEMMPVVYTPTVGQGCQQYSRVFRNPRGLYIPAYRKDRVEEILRNAPFQDVRVIVVTDGERILGLGDQGLGGMGIPVGKLTLYTLCAGIHPAKTLPVLLDCGTNRKELLDDPLYLGWRHERIRGPEYDSFVDAFVEAVKKTFPAVLLQWEDFGKDNAIRLLDRYRDRICSFNDDVQGTGSVTLAGLIAAIKASGSAWNRQRVVMYGAGSAAVGIGRQIVAAMTKAGMAEKDARATIWLVDSRGLVHSGRKDLEEQKREFAQDLERIASWDLDGSERIGLEETVRNVRPTILIGVSAQPASFTEPIVKAMAAHVERPIIFPLSNPTSKCEARPEDILAWTDGRAMVATGSPFPDVSIGGRRIRIGQCNNAFVFPGIGLGVISCGAGVIPDSVFVAAAEALAEMAPSNRDPYAPLYPPIEEVRSASRKIAVAVVMDLQKCGIVPPAPAETVERRIDKNMWEPKYPKYVPA